MITKPRPHPHSRPAPVDFASADASRTRQRLMSWEQAWREGRTGWDAGASSPELCALVAAGALPLGRAFVPGAGSGYDVLSLAHPERMVLGLDIAPSAHARFEALREEAGVGADLARVEVRDVLSYRPEEPFDLWWDYTFLCALDPAERPRWAECVDAVLAPEGELWALVFPLKPIRDDADGPPFPITVTLIEELLGEGFETLSVREPAESHPGREGNELIARFRRR